MRQTRRYVYVGPVSGRIGLQLGKRWQHRLPRKHRCMLGAETIASAGLAAIGQARGMIVDARIGCDVAGRGMRRHIFVAWRCTVRRAGAVRCHIAHGHPGRRMRIRGAVDQEGQAEQGTQQGGKTEHGAIIRQAPGRTVP